MPGLLVHVLEVGVLALRHITFSLHSAATDGGLLVVAGLIIIPIPGRVEGPQDIP